MPLNRRCIGYVGFGSDSALPLRTPTETRRGGFGISIGEGVGRATGGNGGGGGTLRVMGSLPASPPVPSVRKLPGASGNVVPFVFSELIVKLALSGMDGTFWGAVEALSGTLNESEIEAIALILTNSAARGAFAVFAIDCGVRGAISRGVSGGKYRNSICSAVSAERCASKA